MAELRRALREDCGVNPGAHLLVAVSGGPDSVALLVGLHHLTETYPLELSAAHLHHGLRGAEADADLAAVRRHCKALGMVLKGTRWNAKTLMKGRGLSGQCGLRTLRREFLLKAAEQRDADLIATGHTADDQLETMLLRLARGSGLRGLAAIAPRAGRFVRPLLNVTRAEVLRFLEAACVSYRQDRSNLDLSYARNRVRARVVPELARAQRLSGPEALARNAARAARELQRVAALLQAKTRRAFAACAHLKGSRIRLDCGKLCTYATPIRRELLRLAWSQTGAQRGLTLRHMEALDGLLETAASKAKLDLPAGHRARRDGRYLWLEPATRGEAHA